MLLAKLVLLAIAIFQGIIIGFILLKSPFFKSEANQYLSFAIFSLSWSLLKMALDVIQAVKQFPFLRIVEIIDSEMLFPAFILYFFVHQVGHPKKHSKKLRWLFIPALISTVFIAIIDFGIDVNEQTLENLNFHGIIGIALLLITLLVLLLYIPFVLFKTYKIIQYSKQEKEKKWLFRLWLFEVLVLSALMVIIFVGPFVLSELSNAMQILALFASLITHWVSYTGVYKLKLINDQNKIRALLNSRMQLKIEEAIDSASLSKNVKSLIEQTTPSKKIKKPTKENVYYKELERLCLEQKIYRDSSLDRYSVAQKLDISPSYLSQLINTITGENFSTYINRYRVEEVKELIMDKEFDNYSLLSIGLECGFSSKTTFHNAFKKITGVTPNTYKKTHK